MRTLFHLAVVALLCVCAVAQVQHAADDYIVVVGNQAQPVAWNHSQTIQTAINAAQPNGTVIIPSSYTGTECTPISTCNPGQVIVVDWRSGGQGTGISGVKAGLGLAGGGTSGTVTLNLNSVLPAVNGANLTGLTASQLSGLGPLATLLSCGSTGQSPQWNGTTFICATGGNGDVVAAGNNTFTGTNSATKAWSFAQVTFPNGLGAVTHLLGPSDEPFLFSTQNNQNLVLQPNGTASVITCLLNNEIHSACYPGDTLAQMLALCPTTSTCRVIIDALSSVNVAANGSYPVTIGTGYESTGGAGAIWTDQTVYNSGELICTQTGLAANTTVDCLHIGERGMLDGDNDGTNNQGGGFITSVSNSTYRYLVSNAGVCGTSCSPAGPTGAAGYMNYLQQRLIFKGNGVFAAGTSTIQALVDWTAVEGRLDMEHFAMLGIPYTTDLLIQDGPVSDNNNHLYSDGSLYCGNDAGCVPLDIEGSMVGNGINLKFQEVTLGNSALGAGGSSGCGTLLNIDGTAHGTHNTGFLANIMFDGLYLEVSGTYPTWITGHTYQLGNCILESGDYYSVTTASGTATSGSAPNWASSCPSAGNTCTDGAGNVWTNDGATNPSNFIWVKNVRDLDVRGLNLNAGEVGTAIVLTHSGSGYLGRVSLQGYIASGHASVYDVNNLVTGTVIPGGTPQHINYIYPGDTATYDLDGPISLAGSQSISGTQGSTGTNFFVCNGSFTPGDVVTTDSNGNCVDGGAPSGSPTITLANTTSPGTATSTLTKISGSGGTAAGAILLTTDVGGILGICTTNCGTAAGTITIQTAGLVNCVFDGAVTAGDYVIPSVTTGGDCHDTGSGSAGSVGPSVIGRVLVTNGAAGTYKIDLFGQEMRGFQFAATSGCSTSTTCGVAVSWPQTWSSTSYHVICQAEGFTGQGGLLFPSDLTTTGFTLNYQSAEGSTSFTGAWCEGRYNN